MPNYILAMFDKSGEAPEISYNTVGGFAYLTIDELTADGKVDFAAVARRYGLGNADAPFTLFGYNKDGTPNKDYFPWQEVNFSSANPIIKNSIIYIRGKQLDSYTVQAIRNRVVIASDSNLENAIQGILVKNGRFILGERGGTDQVGTLQPVPGGGVRWKRSYHPSGNPIVDAFQSEAYEEAGASTNIASIRLLGIFNQVTEHINRQWLFKGEPSESIDQLVGRVQAGIIFYQQQLAQGKTGRGAKLALRESGHPIDAWENSDVWSFNYDGDTFLKLLSDGQWTNPRGIPLKLIGSLPADLYLAGVVEWGQDFRREADKLPLVKKEIIDQSQPN